MTAYAKPLPTIDDRNRPFWEAARRRELVLRRCQDCERLSYLPFRHCPNCGSERSEWTRVSGRGAVWSYCFFHKAYFPGFEPELPYNVALVELEEGVKMYANLVDIRKEEIRVGMPVSVCFEDVTPDVTLVKFRPADQPETQQEKTT